MKVAVDPIYKISVIVICFWIFTAILGNILPLEFTDTWLEGFINVLRLLSVPVAAVVIVRRIAKRDGILPIKIGKIFLIVCMSCIFILTAFIQALFGGMCKWGTDRIYFENKANPSIKIVRRGLSCGAWDSGQPRYEISLVRNVTGYFIWAPGVDTNSINKNLWDRIDKKVE